MYTYLYMCVNVYKSVQIPIFVHAGGGEETEFAFVMMFVSQTSWW